MWDDPYFEEMMQESEFAKMTFEEQEVYIASMKQKWDYKNSLDFAVEKAKTEAKAEGRAEDRLEIARIMLADHEPLERIVKYSRLSEEEVQALM